MHVDRYPVCALACEVPSVPPPSSSQPLFETPANKHSAGMQPLSQAQHRAAEAFTLATEQRSSGRGRAHAPTAGPVVGAIAMSQGSLGAFRTQSLGRFHCAAQWDLNTLCTTLQTCDFSPQRPQVWFLDPGILPSTDLVLDCTKNEHHLKSDCKLQIGSRMRAPSTQKTKRAIANGHRFSDFLGLFRTRAVLTSLTWQKTGWLVHFSRFKLQDTAAMLG